MNPDIGQLRECFHQELLLCKDSKDIEQLKVRYLGKKGFLQNLMIKLREVSSELRPVLGKEINDFKCECEDLIQQHLKDRHHIELSSQILSEKIDISLPGRKQRQGKAHPLTQMMNEVIDVLKNMGFSVQYGPDIDTDWYNYEGLNFPPDHPAREMQDTFYIDSHHLLRSHTSNTQLRVMEKTTPPIRIIAPGTVYRNENISARSHVFFHQIEGLYVDKNVSFADLFATMQELWNKLLHQEIKTRFRPSYFPFVEPGLEVDIECTQCSGKGCRLCKNSGWLEVCGAGMVHPKVLRNGGIDPEVYSGYAWGMGIERLAMLKFGITDIRLFTENDLRFLSQF
ncbi:MAG: phenylalanine--tRNA ligase subunit alpha [Candidatus Rhabdochlamydia sp.]